MARILVVDDDEDFLKTAKLWIEIQGHECLVANSVEQALAVADQDSPECFILDIRLTDPRPEMEDNSEEVDGVKLFEMLKQRFAKCKAIFVSAHSDYQQDYLQRRGATRLLDKDSFSREIGGAVLESLAPHILLVEDEYAFVETASQLLRSLGVTCIGVTGWDDLKRVMGECDFEHFDAIVVDVLLDPGARVHGWHVAQQACKACSAESFFFLTGHGQSELEEVLGETFSGYADKNQLLAAAASISGVRVLEKKEGWAAAVAAACARGK